MDINNEEKHSIFLLELKKNLEEYIGDRLKSPHKEKIFMEFENIKNDLQTKNTTIDSILDKYLEKLPYGVDMDYTTEMVLVFNILVSYDKGKNFPNWSKVQLELMNKFEDYLYSDHQINESGMKISQTVLKLWHEAKLVAIKEKMDVLTLRKKLEDNFMIVYKNPKNDGWKSRPYNRLHMAFSIVFMTEKK